MPIEDYPLKDAANHGITYAGNFQELEACIAAGLDPSRWRQPHPLGYPKDLRVAIVAWHELHQLVLAHLEEARQAAAEKAVKRRR